jgi:hypothetical protein
MKEGIKKRCISGCDVSFSLSIDATKVPSELEISTTYAAIMGGAHPNHYISTRDMTSMQIESLLKQRNTSPTSIKLADEIKVVIMSFQNCPPGVSPIEIIGVRPQTSNETSPFTEDAVHAAIEATSLISPSSNIFFTNFAVDGVAADSHDVMGSICQFLDGISSTSGQHTKCKE